MEQARYWMWAKQKQPDSNPHIVVPSSPAVNPYGDSWEEQAFAEDAAGSLGGYVWPPRSYSCSFCRREFRSAQALGGHMNVHRRDRARMKQLSPSEVVPQIHALNPCTSLHHSQMSTLLYNNPNPNPEFSDSSCFVRVSSPPKKVINSEEVITTSTLSFFSPVVQKKDVGNNIVSSQAPSWSSFVAEKRNRASDLMKKSAIVEPDSRAEKQDCVTEDLSINLNLDFCGSITKKSSDDEVASCKRRRIEASPLSTLPKLSAFKLCSGSVEELDLELRLGDAPKVK